MKKRKILTILLITLGLISININLFAHSGRTDSNGGHKDNQNIMWESEDKSIATVTSNGWVTGVKPGIVNLTASTSNGVTKTIAIEIVAKKTENNNEISSNNSQESNVVGGIVGVGILGGAGYLIYKKRKNNKK